MNDLLTLVCGDAVESLKALGTGSVQCCVTSPPYWGLRDYSTEGQLGLEKSPDEYVRKMVEVFREVRRVLRKDGTLWLNLGDSYARTGGWSDNHNLSNLPRGEYGRAKTFNNKTPSTLKEKDMCGIPWRVAFALQADGWWLRSDIIWAKPNPMPESVTDRPTKAHEYIFLLTKASSYFWDAEAIKEKVAREWDSSNGGNLSPDGLHKANGEFRERGGEYPVCTGNRNKRSVWSIATQPYPEAHFATFPPEIPKLCILAGSRIGDTMLDPFAGSGTTGAVALELGRKAVLIELNPKYCDLIRQRCDVTPGLQLA